MCSSMRYTFLKVYKRNSYANLHLFYLNRFISRYNINIFLKSCVCRYVKLFGFANLFKWILQNTNNTDAGKFFFPFFFWSQLFFFSMNCSMTIVYFCQSFNICCFAWVHLDIDMVAIVNGKLYGCRRSSLPFVIHLTCTLNGGKVKFIIDSILIASIGTKLQLKLNTENENETETEMATKPNMTAPLPGGSDRFHGKPSIAHTLKFIWIGIVCVNSI